MISILIVVPYPDMYRTVEALLKQHPYRTDVRISLKICAAEQISSLDMSGFDAVIARGYSAEEIETRNPMLPVIHMQMSGIDILRALIECRDLYHPNKIAVCGPQTELYEVQDLAESSLYIQTAFYQSPSTRNLPEVIRRAYEDGCTALIGGYSASLAASKAGLPSVVIKTCADTVLKAINEALRTVERLRAERVVSQMYKTIIYSSTDGILYIDRDGFIRVRNHTARKMNGGRSLMNRSIKDTFPFLSGPYKTVLATGKEKTGLIHRFPATGICVSISLRPVMVETGTEGVVAALTDITQIQQMESRIRRTLNRRGLQAKYSFDDIVYKSEVMRRTIELSKKYAAADANIVIVGETGTGKELFAQSIHRASRRSNGPFVVINCAALPENLLESELFGYAEGAFTGAVKGGRMGLFEQAHGGTLFLDEIQEIPQSTQVKLLRVLQERQVRRIGDDKLIDVDVRIITATNQSMQSLLQNRLFRRDLMYRLDVLRLYIPPLRDRQEDIDVLFSQRISFRYLKEGLMPPEIAQETSAVLHAYPFYGNIRELYNIVDRICASYSGDKIDIEVLQDALCPQDLSPEPPLTETQLTFNAEKQDMEQGEYPQNKDRAFTNEEEVRIKQALHDCGGHKEEAAKKLGIHRTTLWRKMKRYDLRL